jgi:hypothetical protein
MVYGNNSCARVASDIATIDILERAQRADPEGYRTIGVLTKPDLISRPIYSFLVSCRG